MEKTIKLYNVLFPLWMLLLFPQMWLIVLPGNFIIDSLVLLVLLKMLNFSEIKKYYKRHILKIFGIGLLSDIIGSAYMLIMVMFEIGRMGDEWYITVPALLITAVFIYVLNFYMSFKNFDRKTRIKLSLAFAILTAPYTFLVPSKILYNF